MSRIKLAIAATATLLVTAPMVQAAPFEFAGFYAGVHAGYLDVEADFDGGGGTSSGDGLMGGVQAGYNVVNGNFMWGFETDLSLTNASPCCGSPLLRGRNTLFKHLLRLVCSLIILQF